jgi:uncharacterized protein (DUF1330 family)
MAGYVIAICNKTTDASEMEKYIAKARPVLPHDAEILSAYGRHKMLEGDAAEGIVILRFPTFDAALSWYNSQAYQEARKHRFAGADYRFMVVEGVA